MYGRWPSRQRPARRAVPLGAMLVVGLVLAGPPAPRADVTTPVPPAERGDLDYERSGTLDASNIRTIFWNYGMVGDYPANPAGVDLSVFHSVEVPKGGGMNYSDGITPFVLAKVEQADGSEAHIMETGFRERQTTSPFYNRIMRFEPRPGYFQADPTVNAARSPAISNDPRTWPDFWPDRLDDSDDPGWRNAWNGYFGKALVADQETYSVMDDNYYDAWNFFPDVRDSTRRGLGLRIEVRGFQWSNPQARNVIFWHYDITNEGTTDYNDNIIFGLYMDSGVGGSGLSCDGIFESDDDNAFWDDDFDEGVPNLVYTWDRRNTGVDLSGNCGTTGYLGYAYLETPGNSLDSVDNDEDGMVDELRDGGPGTLITSQPAILSYIQANYQSVALFEEAYGPIVELPAYRESYWWTGDEDLDWTRELHDTGVDGLLETGDTGEGDGMPTAGEPNFDKTDVHESDQIGLTGFKLNRIRPGQGNPNQEVDDILFFTNNANWPERLYDQFTDPDPNVRFGDGLSSNYNIGFLFASGPFTLAAGQRERFSLALAYGADITELRRVVRTVQQIYDANYRFAVPPPPPTVTAEAGDGFVRLSWDNVAEDTSDPVTGELDFEGYRIYRSTDPEFRDPRVITTGTGSGPLGNGRPLAQYDLQNEWSDFSEQTVDGVAYFLGANTGLTHTFTDDTVTNGKLYYYAVTAYDHGSSSPRFDFYPSENPITVSRTPRGGLILPTNAVATRPNPRVAGYRPATTGNVEQIAGRGVGSVNVTVVGSEAVEDGHVYSLTFAAPSPDSVRATSYALTDSTTGTILFENGRDLIGAGTGPAAAGLLPVIATQDMVAPDTVATGFTAASDTDAQLKVAYRPVFSINRRRPGYPDDVIVRFSDTVVDTSLAANPFMATPAKFRVFTRRDGVETQRDFLFRDTDLDGTLSHPNDLVDMVTNVPELPSVPISTWRLSLAATTPTPTDPPAGGDEFELILTRPFGEEDVLVFTAQGDSVDEAGARADFSPYVVPNPYIASASFEPERFAVSGRGERRLEFRGLPASCTVRIYTVRGELVQTLVHDGSNAGIVAWNLRTKDNLDVAPGLYIYHVDAAEAGTAKGKFAIIK
jgi:hypothetical protein